MAARKSLPALVWLAVALMVSGCAAGIASPPEQKDRGTALTTIMIQNTSSGGSQQRKALPVGCWEQVLSPSANPSPTC